MLDADVLEVDHFRREALLLRLLPQLLRQLGRGARLRAEVDAETAVGLLLGRSCFGLGGGGRRRGRFGGVEEVEEEGEGCQDEEDHCQHVSVEE